MVRANLRLVVIIARSHVGKGLGLQDLIQEGSFGLLRAVDGFDATYKTRFSTYASYWIKQAIKTALVNQAKTIRIPAYMHELLTKWMRETARLKTELGREPAFEEVARELKIPNKKYAILKQALRSSRGVAQADEEWPLEEQAQEQRPAPPDFLIHEEEVHQLLAQLEKMDKQDAAVLRMRFGIDEEKKTLEAIGKKFSVSKERVRQLEADALKTLREHMEG